MTKIKVSLCQLNFHVGKLDYNYNLIKAYREQSANNNVDLCIFSELCITGYPPEDLVLRPSFIEAAQSYIDKLVNLSKDNGPAIIIGYPRLNNENLYNSGVLIDNGKVTIVDKYHLPNYGVFDEVRVFNSGRVSGPIAFRGIRIGLMICEDMWHKDVVETLIESGAQLLVVINGSPYDQNKEDERLSVAISRVLEAKLPLIYVNQVGGQDELVFDGGSFVLNAKANLILQCLNWETEMKLVDIELHEDNVNVISNDVKPQSIGIESDYKAMVIGLRDYVFKNNFNGVILGLSGGIDSALAAAIATDALGKKMVRGMRMPSRYSSQGSLDDAEETSKLLGIKMDTINIDNLNNSFLKELEPQFKGLKLDTTEENIQSRIRGILLMALSNKFGNMVLSTGNKSEISVGYTTIYGDMNGGFTVLKDAYKTDVYNLAKWRNENFNNFFMGPKGLAVPLNSINKEPSAELNIDQKDQDNLPPYNILDDILKRIIENEESLADIIKSGHEKLLVKRVYKLLLMSEYKRRQSAPGVKLTARSFGKERRYPITNAFTDDK